MITKVTLYRWGRNWRWRMVDGRSRKIIGASTEGYRKRSDALKNLNRVTSSTLVVEKDATGRVFQWIWSK